MVTRSPQEVYHQINLILNNSESKIISIDGWSGSGKSYFLQNLLTDVNKLSVDDYFEKHRGLYLDVIGYDELKNVISDCEGSIVIEGICIQKVLDHIGVQSNMKIYIKRLGAGETWFEEEYINKKTAEDVFQEDDRNLEYDIITGEKRVVSDREKKMAEKRQGVFYDLVRYHYEYLPHTNSDIIYERLDESNE